MAQQKVQTKVNETASVNGAPYRATGKKQELYILANQAEWLIAMIVFWYKREKTPKAERRAFLFKENHYRILDNVTGESIRFTVGWPNLGEDEQEEAVSLAPEPEGLKFPVKGVCFAELKGKYLMLDYRTAKARLISAIESAEAICKELGIQLPDRNTV